MSRIKELQKQVKAKLTLIEDTEKELKSIREEIKALQFSR
jgi:hypothetical protein